MNREAFPNIDYDMASVSTIWPGASPQDIEKLVTNPLEEGIKGVDGIKEYRSYSIQSRSSIHIVIDPDVEDSQDVIDDIRSAIERIEDLPEDAEKPLLTEITTARMPVIEWALIRPKNKQGSYSISYKDFRQLAENLENRFLQLGEVARVNRRGWYDTEIYVDLNPARMLQYLVGGNDVVRALRRRNVNLPGGELNLGKEEVIVRTVGEFSTAEEVRRVPVRSNEVGSSVKVQDVAYVYEDFSEAEYLQSTENADTIALTIVKRASADIITTVEKTREITKDFQALLPSDLKIVAVNDFSYFVKRRLKVLLSNGVIGLLLVIGILFFFLGWRTALMVSFGIPIAFAIGFILMSYADISLNLISMFGLIIVLGIIVDDAIIVSENFARHHEAGMDAKEAAAIGTAEVIPPVLATAVTTVAAFGPMLFATGIFGKFIFTIPFVVIICLLGSVLECFFILPSHLYDMNRKRSRKDIKTPQLKKKDSPGTHLFHLFRTKLFEPLVLVCLKHKGLTLLCLFVLFVLSIALQVAFGNFKLFPSAMDNLYIKIEGAVGTSKKETERYVKAIGQAVATLPDTELDSFTGTVGVQRQNPNDPFTRRGSHYAMLRVYLYPSVDRKYPIEALIERLRRQTSWLLGSEQLLGEGQKTAHKISDVGPIIAPEYADLKGTLVNLNVEKMGGGPPVGKPVAIEVLGKDFDKILEVIEEYKKLLEQLPGVQDISTDFLPGKDEIHVKVNEDLAAQANVSVWDVATAVNTGFEGAVATSIRRINEEVDIRVRFAEKYRKSEDALRQVRLSNAQGNLIPVKALADFERTKSITAINHLNGKRIITLTANLDERMITPSKVAQKLDALGKDIPKRYPDHTIQFGGEHEDTQESLASLQRTFLIGLGIIFMVLASLFRSLLLPFVVLSALPFALIGVILAFLAHGEPFSFLAFMGMIGLMGVVVNDSIVLVDFANRLRQAQPHLSNAQVTLEAASTRLRPVLLTSMTTIGGLLPTAYGLGGYDPFLVGMALSFAWGLFFGTFLILLVVPVLYNLALDFIDKPKKLLPIHASQALLYKIRRLLPQKS